jgi:hypothetical protein
MSESRALAFGELSSGLWGVAWSPAQDGPIEVAVGAGPEADVLTATLTGSGEDGEWRLDGDRVELALSPSAAATRPGGGPDARLEGFDQLCRASGRLTLGGGERAVSCLASRSARDGTLQLERIESFRLLTAWFEPDEGLALIALRPRKSRGQESDLVSASVLEPRRPPVLVTEPRLSTTYTAAGVPARAGVELWIEEAVAEDQGEEAVSSEQFPRRAAGEALGAGTEWHAAGFALHAVPLVWHSRGRDGAGTYLLGRRP